MAIATRGEIEIEAAPEDVGMSSAGLRNLSYLVQSYIDDRKLPGAISLVARRGKVVHFETYGSMDDERQKPMRSDTIFRIYSMTKPIASVGLMMLYEQGKFQLDDPASTFIPELKGLKVFAGGTADDPRLRQPGVEREVPLAGGEQREPGFRTGRRPGPGPHGRPPGETTAPGASGRSPRSRPRRRSWPRSAATARSGG